MSSVASASGNAAARSLGLLVAALGSIVLAGWWLDMPSLQSVLPGLVTMKFNTALALAACGAGVACLAAGRSRGAVLGLALAVLVLAASTLSQDLFGWDLHIDQLLRRDNGSQVHTARPGRMSPSSAFCFLVTGIALSVLALRVRWGEPLVFALGSALAAIAAMALLGQLSDGMFAVRWWNVKGMAVHTAFSFLAIGTALILLALRDGPQPWVLGRAGTAGFAAGVALMVAASNLSFGYAEKMRQAAEDMQRGSRGLAAVAAVAGAMHSLESSQRGFLITGDEAMVAMRQPAIAELGHALEQLQPLAAASPELHAHLASLRRLVDQRLELARQTIELRRDSGFQAAQQLMATGRGVKLMAAIEQALAAIGEHQQRTLAAERERWEALASTAVLILPLGMLLSFVTLIAGLVFLNRNLDRTRQAQQAAQASGQRLAGIVDSAMDAVISVDVQQRVVMFNRAAERMFACPAARALGRPLDDFVPERFRAPHAGHVQAFGTTGVTSRSMGTLGMLTALRADGTEFPIEASISQIELSGEKIYTVILRDITQRLEADEIRVESEKRLQAVTQNLSEGLVLADTGGQMLHWNPAALAMHGLAQGRSELLAFADTFELSTLEGERVPQTQWPLARVLDGDSVRELELRVRRRREPWERVFSYSGAVVSYAPGRQLAFLSIRDITERELSRQQVLRLNADLERRVAERTAQLEAKSRELESFCYSVSHDLKAPLRGIDGYSLLLLEDHAAQLDEDGRTCANNVRIATQHMTALIEDLLTYSRQERRSIVPARIDLRSFVEHQIGRRRADFEAVDLRLEIPPLQVDADHEALAMALRNLIDNALKFSAHREKPSICVRSLVQGGRCVLSVQDNGTGFDMRFHDRIFEIFQRLHRMEEYPGTGIGLALVRKAAERMGGRVWAESTPGAGAVFHLELKVADPDTAAVPA
jgi:PAS domain S-box-containing protein